MSICQKERLQEHDRLSQVSDKGKTWKYKVKEENNLGRRAWHIKRGHLCASIPHYRVIILSFFFYINSPFVLYPMYLKFSFYM